MGDKVKLEYVPKGSSSKTSVAATFFSGRNGKFVYTVGGKSVTQDLKAKDHSVFLKKG